MVTCFSLGIVNLPEKAQVLEIPVVPAYAVISNSGISILKWVTTFLEFAVEEASPGLVVVVNLNPPM